jgi:hypothetical protein
MQQVDRWIARTALVALGAVLGWLASGGRPVAAQSPVPQVAVRELGPSSSLVVYYPEQNTVYIYSTPFVELPDSNCAYKFHLSTPGGKVTRQPCS